MKVAIASCIKVQDLAPQAVWDEIRASQPDVLLLLGDNVYLDRNDHGDPQALAGELRVLYRRQFAQPQFAELLAELQGRGGRLFAVCDDHDFLGDNRCGGDVDPALREAARGEFVRAFSPARTRGDTSDEVYALHRLGIVDLLLLDLRFHRRAAASVEAAMDLDALLGAAQWRWFEAAVAGSRAPYLLVASGTTAHRFGAESWEQYPAAFQRLRSLLAPRRGALVVSGDVHRNAVYDDSGMVEIVSSGAARVGAVFGAERRNWGLLHFQAARLAVQLHGLKVQDRLSFEIALDHWALP